MKKSVCFDNIVLVVAMLCELIILCWSHTSLAGVDVLERSYGPLRTGANTSETVLRPDNVNSGTNQFHKRFVLKVDGKIEGSPLYASGVFISGDTHNVLYIATMHNSVYAFDGDSGAQLSVRSLGIPVTGRDLHALKPHTVHDEWGIASTPVIDQASGTLYVVRWGYENGGDGPTYRLFGLDISDLSRDKFPSVRLDGYKVGNTEFNRRRQMQRAALALAAKSNGTKAVIIAFGGGEGQGSPAGWVVAFEVAKLTDGAATADVWCSSPSNGAGPGGGSGIWMANAAPAIDEAGDIYVVTGNGPYNPQSDLNQLGESVVRLQWTPGSLSASDWFTPFRDIDRDTSHKDQDLAAAGVIALPDEPGLIVGGKDGIYYHVNRTSMGKREFTALADPPFVASFDYQPWHGHTSLFDDLNQVTSTDPFTIGHVDQGRTPHIHGTGVFFNNLLFVNGENNSVRVFKRENKHFVANPLARGTATASLGTSSPGGMPGGILSLSADGISNAILWVNEADGNLPADPAANNAPTPNILRAYDVSTAQTGTLRLIWDSEAEPNDTLGAATKFAPPLVVNGKVYQATYDDQVVVYGLGPPSSTPVRDIRRTVIFIYAEARSGQDLFVRGGSKDGNQIRIRHRNWLNPHTNGYRWGDAYLDWTDGEPGQARPSADVGGGTPLDWTTSLAKGQGQPYVWTAGHGIADENTFGMHYWMLDVDMDCEQAFDDGLGHKWFEFKAFMITHLMTDVSPTPGWEADIAQVSNPRPPYKSANHMGICGIVNVVAANFPALPNSLNPNSAQFLQPSFTYLAPLDERNASQEMLTGTPCVSPETEKRCLGNLAQTCKEVNGLKLFRTVHDCNTLPSQGDYVQMCQRSTGQCCTPGLMHDGNCE